MVKMPNIEMYNVVKNNKTPSGPISIGDVNSIINIKTASAIILVYNIIRLCFITLLYHECLSLPRSVDRPSPLKNRPQCRVICKLVGANLAGINSL